MFFSILAIACQDEWIENTSTVGADVNKPVKVDLKLGIPKSMEVEVTRADNSKSDIETLRLYIFSGDKMLGKPQNVVAEDVKTDDDGHHYTANVTLYEGTQTVYAVANAATLLYWQNPTNTLDAAAAQGKDTFLEAVYDLVNELTSNNYLPGLDSDVIPLTGEGEIEVIGGNSPSVDGTVKLQRPVAKIMFDITEEYTNQEEHKITFNPQYYGVYKVASRGYVIASDGNRTPIADNYFYNTPNDQPATDLTVNGIYVPENIQTGTGCTKYEDREDFDASQGNTDDSKVWTNAPQNATYIVLRGTYTETDAQGNLYRSANVSYTIHLGDWNSADGYNDFSVLRNYIYTYKLTVQGVDKIVVEAEAEEDSDDFQNGAEGDVIELGEGSEVFNLDAHYEQVYVQYNLSDIAQQIRNTEGYESRADELIANAFMLTIHSPMNRVGATEELLKPYNGDDENGTTIMSDFDSDWIEFYSQENNGLSTYTSTNGNDDYLLNAWQACRKMGQAVKLLVDNPNSEPQVNGLHITPSSGKYYARFTIFVEENFYEHDLDGNPVDWADFTRIDPRTLLIATNMEISPDGNSSYATARTYISQASIQTFYNRDSSDDTNALGIELYNEYGTINGFSSGYIQSGDDPSNGRENMLKNISNAQWNNGNHEKVNFTRIGYTSANVNSHTWPNITSNDKTNSAYIACLSRNRDLNRDGRIDDGEVHWYLPARSQYLRMGIGANSLGDYQLYTGNKSLMRENGYPGNYVGDGSLYYSNTATGNDAWELYWAVEVGAYGSNSYGSSAQIRCVRNLPSRQHVIDHDDPNGDDALAGPVHGGVKTLSSGNYIFDFDNRLDGSLYRSTVQDNPYPDHNEMNTTNRLPGAFVVAKQYVGEENRRGEWVNESFTVREGWSASTRNNPCANYSEDNDPEGYVWHVPNLSELTVMSTVADEIDLLKTQNGNERATLCSTKFSNDEVRIGFRYNGSMISAWSPGVADRSTGYVRCVRDATPEEIAEVRPQQ